MSLLPYALSDESVLSIIRTLRSLSIPIEPYFRDKLAANTRVVSNFFAYETVLLNNVFPNDNRSFQSVIVRPKPALADDLVSILDNFFILIDPPFIDNLFLTPTVPNTLSLPSDTN